jgi:hypothetical protein
MGVIVTRQTTGSGSGSASGGAYTLLEKLSMEMEMEFKAVKLYGYKELSYNVQKQLIDLDIWENELKLTRLFHKDFSYNPQKQLTRTYLKRYTDGETLTRLFIYNAQKQLISIATSGSGPY